MRFDNLSKELIEKAKKCDTSEERRAFIEDNGIELTDEQLEGIAGGDKEYTLLSHSHPYSQLGTHGKNAPGQIPRGYLARPRGLLHILRRDGLGLVVISRACETHRTSAQPRMYEASSLLSTARSLRRRRPTTP